MSGEYAFLDARYELGTLTPSGQSLALQRLPPGESDRLAVAFAAIDPWVRYPYPASSLAGYLNRSEPSARRLAIMAGAEIAGAVGLRIKWLRGPFLQFLGVLPPYQGRGLGQAVLAWFEREGRASGERNLWVTVSDFNTRGIKFYQRQGYVPIAALEGLVRDERTEILMRKRL